jgi:hypothetical protein
MCMGRMCVWGGGVLFNARTCCGSMYMEGEPAEGERVMENPAAPSGTISWKYWDPKPQAGSPVRIRVTANRASATDGLVPGLRQGAQERNSEASLPMGFRL